MHKLKLFFAYCIVYIYIFSHAAVVNASYSFNDSFGTSYSAEWVTLPNHPNPIIDNGQLVFDVLTTADKFPYIAHSGTEPIKSMSFDFSYVIDGSDFGSGVVLTDSIPLSEISPPVDSDDYILAVYVTPNGKFYLFSPLCGLTGGCSLSIHPYAFYTLEPSTIYRLRFEFSKDHLMIYNNDILLKTFQMSAYRANGVYFGNSMQTATPKYWQHFNIDNVSIIYSDYAAILPTFPYLTQKDPLWAHKEYDSATSWAGVDKSGIDRWGCALTSAAMVLQKYGVKALDGAPVDPDKLNTWLKSQSDGYIGPGLLNWLAVTRYVKTSYTAGHADTKLEFVRSYMPTLPVLPAILGLPGHFVVAYSEDATNWKINDPNNVSKTVLAKASTVNSVNRFLPSLTDLSYMLFTANPGLVVTLRDSVGNIIPMDWKEEFLVDDVDELSSTSVMIAMLPKPVEGEYTLLINNSTGSIQSLATYLYDRDGEVSQDNLNLPAMTSATFIIQYAATPTINSPITLDYTSIFDYLRSLRVPKSPANGVFQALYTKFAELLSTPDSINDLNKFIAVQSPKHITPVMKSKLQNYIMLIKEN